jgi:cell division protein FtsQ
MIRAGLVVLLVATLVVASYVLMPIEELSVVGNRQLSEAQILHAAGLELGGPWLWAWPYKLTSLLQNPWVLSVSIERPDIGQLRLVVLERTAVATVLQNKTSLGLSQDGVLLLGAKPRPPYIEAVAGIEGSSVPTADIIELLQTFPTAQRIRYTSQGYQVLGPALHVWGANVKQLQDWSKLSRIERGAGMAKTQTAKPVYVYSWGVSTQ